MRNSRKTINSLMTAKRRILIPVLMASLLLAGCEKGEGVYSAKKKIAEVYKECSGHYMSWSEENGEWEKTEYTEPRYMCEQWEWNRSKLQSIKYFFRDGEAAATDVFTYDDGLVVEKRDHSNSCRTTFAYTGKELQTIMFYMDGLLYSSTRLTHKDGKIVEAATTFYNMSKSDVSRIPQEALMFAPYTAHRLASGEVIEKAAGQEELFSERVTIEWSEDDIMSVTSYYDGLERAGWNYRYDTKKNPLRNFWTKSEVNGSTIPLYGSESNVTNCTMTEDWKTAEDYSYEYTYDGDYPAKVICTKYDRRDARFSNMEKTTTEYIYK